MRETVDVNGQLLARAQTGDGDAFAELTEPLRRELQAHCYRILGSAADAEDMLQETMMAAWRGLDRFEERASLRTWLHAIATNKCLNHLRASRSQAPHAPEIPLPEPTRGGEPLWLEPYPDALLGDLPDADPGPEARYEARESVSLAFVTTPQYLPPRQRVALLLRDVLGFRAAETAAILVPLPGSAREHRITAASPTHSSAAMSRPSSHCSPTTPGSRCRRCRSITRAATRSRTSLARSHSFRHGVRRSLLIPTRANGQPAFGRYLRDPHTPVAHAHGLIVLTLAGDRISAITGFTDNSVLPRFGLPRALPNSAAQGDRDVDVIVHDHGDPA